MEAGWYKRIKLIYSFKILILDFNVGHQIGHYENWQYTSSMNTRLKVYDGNGNEIINPQSQCVGQCHDCKRVDEGNTAEIKDGDVWLGGKILV